MINYRLTKPVENPLHDGWIAPPGTNLQLIGATNGNTLKRNSLVLVNFDMRRGDTCFALSNEWYDKNKEDYLEEA